MKLGAEMYETTTLNGSHPGGASSSVRYEFIDGKELASRWSLPESWVREQVRSRSADPLPHIRFGKYVPVSLGQPGAGRVGRAAYSIEEQ
jgi:hypothetical protein